MTWTPGFDAETTGLASYAAGATGKVFMGAFTFADHEEKTLVRTRGRLGVGASTSTAGDRVVLAVGLGIIQTDSTVIGATALPGPLSDAGWDGWLWHGFFLLYASTQPGQPANGLMAEHMLLDSKAMRKWQWFDEALFAMAEVSVNTMDGPTDIRLATRHLYKQ